MTRETALNFAKNILMSGKIEEYKFEARQIVLSVLKISERELLLYPKVEISHDEENKIKEISKKRSQHYPLQYLLGEWDFFGRTFAVGEGVLIPRSDTEILCETALEILKNKNNLKIVDLFSGSGAIAVTLDLELKGRADTIFAIEKSPLAFKYLNLNIKNLSSGVKAVLGDALDTALADKFCGLDLITANPPYLNKADMDSLQREVRFEPAMALSGGSDGLLFYKKFIPLWYLALKPGGVCLTEIGSAQGAQAAEIFKNAGYGNVEIIKDLAQRDRIVRAEKMPDKS